MTAGLAARMGAAAEAVHACLTAHLAGFADAPVVAAMRYALAGGKGLRGFLVLEGARLHDVPEAQAIWAAAAIEAVHSYSLVHDDLPAMDDDDLRRGRPTVHRQWDEATAILAGDGLLTLAFDLLACPDCGVAERRIALTGSLAEAAGARGMVLGQALDIAAGTVDRPLTLEEITALQQAKTGALFDWAACAGPRLAGADIDDLRRYAGALGLAFQIADDILDVEGDAAAMGKAVGKDAGLGKATFVSLLGLDGAKARARDLAEEACGALVGYGSGAEALREAARFAIARRT